MIISASALTALGLMAVSASAATLLHTWGGHGGFESPKGIAVAHGHVYVADHGSHSKQGRMQVFTTDGHFVRAWEPPFGMDACSVTVTHNRPVRVIVGVCKYSRHGNDHGGVVEFTEDGRLVADTYTVRGAYVGHLGPIEGVAVNGHDIYAADPYSDHVFKFRHQHNDPSHLAEVDAAPFPYSVSNPEALAIDSLGHMYWTEDRSRIVREWHRWGSHGSMPGQFNHPSGIAFGPHGNVYVADTGNNRIQEFTSTGAYLNQWTQPGPDAASFASPGDVAVDAEGNVYVADTGNRRVVKFAP